MSEHVRIICASGNTPIMANGVVLKRNEQQVMIRCDDEAARIECGAKVVLTFRAGDERWTGLVEQVEPMGDGVEIRLTAPNSHAAEKRDYPRLHAGIPLRYRAATEQEVSNWLAGAELTQGWQTPDPYMNFSVSGLRFEVSQDVRTGQILLVELRVGDASPTWRTTVRVIRVFASHDDSPSSAAVSFEHLPPAALDALSDLTLQIQDTLL